MKKALLIAGLLFMAAAAWAQEAESKTENKAENKAGKKTGNESVKNEIVKNEPVKNQKQDGPQFAFENPEYDFGDISHKSRKVECRFEFVNEGSAPLVITKTLTSCTCVKVSYDKKPVMPGVKGVVTVAYEVNKKEPGIFYKVIEVYSNAPEKRTNLVIKGNAVAEEKK